MAHFDAVGCATALYKACKGWGTDEAAVFGNLDRIQTQNDWQTVIDAYARNHQDFHNGDLRAALDSDLTTRELAQAKEILRKKGIQWYGTYASAGPVAAGHTITATAGSVVIDGRQYPYQSVESPRRQMMQDGECQPLPAQEVTFTVPRIVQRTVVEPKVTHKTEMVKKAVPQTIVETVPYEETIMVPEARTSQGTKEVEVQQVEEIERTLKTVNIEPKTVKKKVIVTRPEKKTIETTELRAEPVEVQKEVKTMVMVPMQEKATHMDIETVMTTRTVERIQSVPRVVITSKTCDATVMDRLITFMSQHFGDISGLNIVTTTEQRQCMVDEQYPVTVEVPRNVDRITMVPQEQVQVVKVTEIQDKEVPVTREVVEMISEEREIEVTEMIETVTEHIVKEPQLVTKTVTVPDESFEIVKVPHRVTSYRQQERQEMTHIEEPVQVPHTEMVTRCVQDHFEETRTLRFDPITGEQIGAYQTTTPVQPGQPVRDLPPPPPVPQSQPRTEPLPEPGRNCLPVWVCANPDQQLPVAGMQMPGGGMIASVGQPQAVPHGVQPTMFSGAQAWPTAGQYVQDNSSASYHPAAAPQQREIISASPAQMSVHSARTPSPAAPMVGLTPEQAQAVMRAELEKSRLQAASLAAGGR